MVITKTTDESQLSHYIELTFAKAFIYFSYQILEILFVDFLFPS